MMTDRLMADFNIGASGLGNFSAFFFLSYVAMQIPTGILCEVWGARRLLTAGALISAAGAFLFAVSPGVAAANAGRLLIGGSVAVAYVSMLKLAAHWFAPRMYAAMGGFALLCGVIGAVSAGVPLRMLVDAFGWRPVMFAASAAGLTLAAAMWLVVRDAPEDRGYSGYAPVESRTAGLTPGELVRGLKTVLTYKNTWLLSLAPAGMVGPILAFSGLWGVPFFTTHYGLSPAGAAAMTSALMVAWAAGGPLLGGLSDRIGRRKPLYLAGALVACCGWSVIVYVQGISIVALTVLVLVVGFASGVMIIGFAFVKESVPLHLAGTVTGVCNMGVMTGPMILQPAIGIVLERYWSGAVENGARIYDLTAYRTGFGLMIGFSVATALLVALATETRCRQIEQQGGLLP